MTRLKTKEAQYGELLTLEERIGRTSFGLMSNQVWHDDPKRLAFVLSRYKFVARMLNGKNSALEIGCADAFGTRIVQQSVPNVTAVDFDPVFISDAQSRQEFEWPLDLRVHNILDGPVMGPFESAFCVDVLEHIDPAEEQNFVDNVIASIIPEGAAIFGIPSSEGQAYGSAQSREGHVNCKSGDELQAFLSRSFHNVFLFSMNDEVVHTGFTSMAHYLFAVCCGGRR